MELKTNDPINEAAMIAEGYTKTHYTECWMDVGGAESGPIIKGYAAHDEWVKGITHVYVMDGNIVHIEDIPEWDDPNGPDLPF